MAKKTKKIANTKKAVQVASGGNSPGGKIKPKLA